MPLVASGFARAARGAAAVRALGLDVVLRATFSPTDRCVVLLLLVASLRWPSAVCCTAVAERGLVKHKHHGWCWLVLVPLFIMNSPVMVHLAQPSSLDVLVLVGVQIR